MLDFLRLRAIAGIEHVGGNAYARTIEIDGAQGHVCIEPASGDALRATIVFPVLSALPGIIGRIRRIWPAISHAGPACGSPGPGTGSSWRSGPCSASRSR
jgi:AraC family transcriptional regulator of adaptative response / DNA-3-methyladenine glycosylase II